MNFERLIMVLGAPRSGTSWLGKIFDSHPDVLYRHEPDLALWEPQLPFLISDDRIDAYSGIAAQYVTRLITTPTLKASGQVPVFRKGYYRPGARALRAGMIHGLRWIEGVSGSRRMRAFPVPDFVNPESWPNLRIVMKSVSARGRARVLLEALPGMRMVFLLRHPCGQVASTLRGQQQGRFDTGVFVRDVLATPGARTYGLTEEQLNAASHVEQLAWHWATMNELVTQAISGRANARVLRYEDLCHEPVPQARELFQFSGLDWNPQTEGFVRDSTTYSGNERYFSVFRNAIASTERWRSELRDRDQRLILDVVAQTSLARLWSETSSRRSASSSALVAADVAGQMG
jgi:hypothetical protein